MNIYNTTITFNKIRVSTKTRNNKLILTVNDGHNQCKIFFDIRTQTEGKNLKDIFIISTEQFENGQNLFANLIYYKFIDPKVFCLSLSGEDIEKIFENIYNYVKK